MYTVLLSELGPPERASLPAGLRLRVGYVVGSCRFLARGVVEFMLFILPSLAVVTTIIKPHAKAIPNVVHMIWSWHGLINGTWSTGMENGDKTRHQTKCTQANVSCDGRQNNGWQNLKHSTD